MEQKAAEKVIECIFEVLINNIVGFSDAMHTRHFLPWRILNATEQLKMTSYLTRACGQWAKEEMLKPSFFKVFIVLDAFVWWIPIPPALSNCLTLIT